MSLKIGGRGNVPELSFSKPAKMARWVAQYFGKKQRGFSLLSFVLLGMIREEKYEIYQKTYQPTEKERKWRVDI
jgi:hypothetical protein